MLLHSPLLQRPLLLQKPFLTAFAAGSALAFAAPAQVGDPVPEIEADAVYNFDALRLKELSQLRGSAIFLEYWATW